MKRVLMLTAAGLALLLGGCATTIRSDVTAFHQWPAQVEDKSYVFEAPPPQDDTLELRSYQELVRGQLARLGFHDAGTGKAALTVSMRFTTIDVPVRMVQVVDPFFYGPSRFAWYGPRHRRYWGGWYSPFYDPFWDSRVFEDRIVHQYHRELQVGIKSATESRRLFDVTVRNVSRQYSTPAVMPALVQSAFEGFPGPSGVARRIELKQQG
jgi:hypothetical protein